MNCFLSAVWTVRSSVGLEFAATAGLDAVFRPLWQSFTAGAREVIESVTLDDCFQTEFWKEDLRWFALVEPHEDVVPVKSLRSEEGSDPSLGWNFLSSKQPVWISGPDAVAAKLITGNLLRL
jgi:hypothetical protein